MMNVNPKKLRVTVNDRLYEVEVDDLSTSPISVKVNGRTYAVKFETDAVAQASAAETPVGPAVAPSAGPPVKKLSTATGPAEANAKAVTAPLPGNIVSIAVKPGDQVNAGQEICSLEAMKMNNAIRSPRDGVIAGVEVSLGQVVNHGDILATFE